MSIVRFRRKKRGCLFLPDFIKYTGGYDIAQNTATGTIIGAKESSGKKSYRLGGPRPTQRQHIVDYFITGDPLEIRSILERMGVEEKDICEEIHSKHLTTSRHSRSHGAFFYTWT